MSVNSYPCRTPPTRCLSAGFGVEARGRDLPAAPPDGDDAGDLRSGDVVVDDLTAGLLPDPEVEGVRTVGGGDAEAVAAPAVHRAGSLVDRLGAVDHEPVGAGRAELQPGRAEVEGRLADGRDESRQIGRGEGEGGLARQARLGGVGAGR